MLSKASRRWLIPLLLIAGLLFITTPADAQSRGQTNGRTTKTEKKEAGKSATSRSSRSSNNRSSSAGTASSSRQRSSSGAGASSQSGSSQNRSTASRSQQRSRSSSTTANRNQTRTSNQSTGRSSRSGSSTSANSSRNSSRGSSGRSTPSASGSSNTRSGNASSGSRGSSSQATRSSGTSRTTNRGSSTQSTRQSDNRSSGASTGRTSSTTRTRDRSVSSTRERSTTRTTTDNRDRQSANSGRTSSSSRGTTARQNNGRSRTVVTDRNRTVQTRRDNTTVQIQPSRRHHGSSRQVYTRKNYKHRPTLHVKKNVYVSPVYYHRPHIQVNVTWPWQNRYYRKWKPHYRYKQVVYVNVGHGRKYRTSRIDVRTDYHQEVRYADHRKAVVDIYLDRIEVYEDGYFYGEVYKIPSHLSHIEATIYRNGDIVYDKDVFVVGDPRAGFEMISTRNYDGHVLDYYDRSHGYKVGKLNFRSRRVESRRYSRLFDPYDYNSYAPISLLPEDQYLADYGYESVSYNYYDDDYDPYYGGSYDDDYYDYYDDGSYYQYEAPRGNTYGKSPDYPSYSKQSVNARIAAAGPIKMNKNSSYTTRAGLSVKFEREAQLERIR